MDGVKFIVAIVFQHVQCLELPHRAASFCAPVLKLHTEQIFYYCLSNINTQHQISLLVTACLGTVERTHTEG